MLICLSQKYQASVDGFSAKNFHDYCDGLKHTLTIVKTTRGYIFGGYTDEAWNSHNEYVKDPNAFIFSLINRESNPLKMKCLETRYTVRGHSGRCIQQYGDALCLSSNSNVTMNSFSNLGDVYNHPSYAYGSTQANEFMAGSAHFKNLEIEMYIKQA